MKLRYAVFDLDGTLLDSMRVWKDVGEIYLKSQGVPVPPDLKERLKTMSIAQSSQWFAELGVPLPVGEIIRGINDIPRMRYQKDVMLKPGAGEFLRAFHAGGARLAVATAIDSASAEMALRRLSVRDCFSFILTSFDVQSGKDDPAIYLEAARRLGAPPKDVVVFEDALYCIRTAKAAGFPVAAVRDGANRDDEEAIRALCDWYLESFVNPPFEPPCPL